MDWPSYLRAVVSRTAGAAVGAAATPGGPIAAASAKAATETVSDLLLQFLGAHDEQMDRLTELAEDIRGRLMGLQDAVGGLLDAPWRTALAHIEEAGRRPAARERELELARVRLFDAWGAAEALLERNARSTDPAALRCPVIAQQIAAVYGFLGEPQNARSWLVTGYLASRQQLGHQVDRLHDLLVDKVRRAKSPAGDVHSLIVIAVRSLNPNSDDPLWVRMPGKVSTPIGYASQGWEKSRRIAHDVDFERQVVGLAAMDAEAQLLRLTCLAAGATDPRLQPNEKSPKVASGESAEAGEKRVLRRPDAALVVFSPITTAHIIASGYSATRTVLEQPIAGRYREVLPYGFI
jgi:hypothetical protein